MASSQRKLPDTMTADEFLAWPGDGAGGKYQLVDGALRAMSPASAVHGRIQGNLAKIIATHLDDGASGRCGLYTEPAIHVQVRAKINTRVPDLGVSCAKVTAQDIALPDPILLIEILSPGNKSDTWDNVWAYCTIPSVREILIISSTRMEAEFLQRDANGNWPSDAINIGTGGTLSLSSIDLTILLADAYAGTYLAGA